MRSGDLSPLGGNGGTVEVDETYVGKIDAISRKEYKATRYPSPFKNVVLTLVERGGSARSFHISNASVASVLPILQANINREAALMTDSASLYRGRIGKAFASHEYVDHNALEWARGKVSTNTVEGFYSIFKRGMKGVYQHCSEKHLHRCLAEFDFRYSNRVALGIGDQDRAERALVGVKGKRLTYQGPTGLRVNA